MEWRDRIASDPAVLSANKQPLLAIPRTQACKCPSHAAHSSHNKNNRRGESNKNEQATRNT